MLARLGSDGSAHLVGGSFVEALDTVIYCTGYQYRYSFLERTGLLSTGTKGLFALILKRCAPFYVWMYTQQVHLEPGS